MATAISKQRLYRKYANFPKAYRIIHLETSSDIVMREDGTTVEDALKDMDAYMKALKALIDILNSYFDEDHILKPEHGGSGGDNLPLLLYNMIMKCNKSGSTGITKDDLLGFADISDKIGKSITVNDFAQFIATLITTKPFIQANTAPANHDIIWIDSANSNTAKFYDPTNGWTAIKTAWA